LGSQALDQVQAYIALHRFLQREKLPTDEAPEPETLAAAAASYLQERTMLLGCVQAVLLYAQGERHRKPLCAIFEPWLAAHNVTSVWYHRAISVDDSVWYASSYADARRSAFIVMAVRAYSEFQNAGRSGSRDRRYGESMHRPKYCFRVGPQTGLTLANPSVDCSALFCI